MKTKNTYFKFMLIVLVGMLLTNIVNAQNFNGGNGSGFSFSISFPTDFENINSVGGIKVDYYSMTVFPNPSNGAIALAVEDLANGSLEIEITDLTGRQISLYEWEINSAENLFRLDLSDTPAGLYLIRATGKSKVYLSKISIY